MSINAKLTIKRSAKDKQNPYLMIKRDAVRDRSLSWKARGILSFLLSNRDDWKIYVQEVQEHSEKDGRDSTNAGVKELIEGGYLTRTRLHGQDGKFKGYDYELTESPTVNGLTVNGLAVNGKPATNKYKKVIRDSSICIERPPTTEKVKVDTGETLPTEKAKTEDAEFKKLWDLYERKDNKKKARSAWNQLSKKDRGLLLESVPAYKIAQPEKKYRAMLATYINGRRWEDEEIVSDAPAAQVDDILLSPQNEASYQRFTKALKESLGDKHSLVKPLTRKQYQDWSLHKRRPLTSQFHTSWHRGVLEWIKSTNLSSYKLKKEIETADVLLFDAFDGFLANRGKDGYYSETAARKPNYA